MGKGVRHLHEENCCFGCVRITAVNLCLPLYSNISTKKTKSADDCGIEMVMLRSTHLVIPVQPFCPASIEQPTTSFQNRIFFSSSPNSPLPSSINSHSPSLVRTLNRRFSKSNCLHSMRYRRSPGTTNESTHPQY